MLTPANIKHFYIPDEQSIYLLSHKDAKKLKDWFEEFIRSINMKLFMGPYVKYCKMPGNRGITAVAIIETSHIAMHIWDEVSPALMQFDVYSCSELDVKDICEFVNCLFAEFFLLCF